MRHVRATWNIDYNLRDYSRGAKICTLTYEHYTPNWLMRKRGIRIIGFSEWTVDLNDANTDETDV